MNNMTIQDLTYNIPEGKKRKYLGNTFFNGLEKYYLQHFKDSEIDIDYLLELNFKDVVLNDFFIKDLRLFCPNELNVILGGKESNNLSTNQISKLIQEFFQIELTFDEKIELDLKRSSFCEAELHDFQERIRRQVINMIFNNEKRFLIHMPTGSGKTRTAGEIIIDFIRLSSSRAVLNENIKILWVAQSSELCYQAYETIKYLYDKKGTRKISFGHFYDKHELDENIINQPAIIFCGIQKLLLNYSKDEIWSKIRNDNYLVIVDEAHRSVAKEWVKALNYFVSNSSTYLLGLTATPGIGKKGDETNYSLSTFYGGNKISISDDYFSKIEKPIEYLVKREFLAEIERIDIDAYTPLKRKITLDEANNFNFSDQTLKELSVNPSRNSSIINIIKENVSLNKKILVFTCGTDHNKILESILSNSNIYCETVDAKSKNRNQLIEKFKTGDLNVLLNYGVLTTGFDAPKTDVCVIARPIKSIVMYSQMVGRILRGPENKGNKKNTLYTIKDNLKLGSYDDMFNSFNQFYI